MADDKNKQLDQFYNMKAEIARMVGGQFGGYQFTITKRIPTIGFDAANAEHEIIADDVLNQYGNGASLRIFVQDFRICVDGATALTGTQTLKLEDNKAVADTPVEIASLDSDELGANAFLMPHSTGVTLAAAFKKNSGLTAGKGLRLRLSSAGPVAAGSDLIVTVNGVIR